MYESDLDDQGRELSADQQTFFTGSKIRDESGHLLTMYHGSSYEFDAFDLNHIRANETDAFYNGFWFSSDPTTLPAWTRLKTRYEVYLNVTNPAPLEVVRNTVKMVRSKWMNPDICQDIFHSQSRSVQDEVRYQLQAQGYDGIIHDWKPAVDRYELEEIGQTTVTSARGTKYVLKKDAEWGGLDLFYYDKDEPEHLGEHLTGYSDLDDYLSLQERTVVWFRPEQIKAVENRTPTLGPNFKHNERTNQEVSIMTEEKGYTYVDSYGDANTVYPRLNYYVSDNNLYLGLVSYEPEIEAMDHYCDVTVNIDTLPYLHAAIDTNNNGQKMVDFLVENGFGEDTGMKISSGFCRYPIFCFNEEKLREIDPVTFAAYAKANGMDQPRLDDRINKAAETKSQSKNTHTDKEQQR